LHVFQSVKIGKNILKRQKINKDLEKNVITSCFPTKRNDFLLSRFEIYDLRI